LEKSWGMISVFGVIIFSFLHPVNRQAIPAIRITPGRTFDF
jgi:hypothetical protein